MYVKYSFSNVEKLQLIEFKNLYKKRFDKKGSKLSSGLELYDKDNQFHKIVYLALDFNPKSNLEFGLTFQYFNNVKIYNRKDETIYLNKNSGCDRMKIESEFIQLLNQHKFDSISEEYFQNEIEKEENKHILFVLIQNFKALFYIFTHLKNHDQFVKLTNPTFSKETFQAYYDQYEKNIVEETLKRENKKIKSAKYPSFIDTGCQNFLEYVITSSIMFIDNPGKNLGITQKEGGDLTDMIHYYSFDIYNRKEDIFHLSRIGLYTKMIIDYNVKQETSLFCKLPMHLIENELFCL